MKLVYYEYGIKINFRENRIQTLVLERPKVFAEFVQTFFQQFQGKDGAIILSDQDEINIHKEVELIMDPINIDINNKRVIGQLYNELHNIANESLEEKFKINSEIVNYLDQLVWKSSL